METTYTSEELDKCDRQQMKLIILSMQEQLTQLNNNYESLIEQIRLANQQRFGRATEKLDQIDGQMSFFDEAEYLSDDNVEEPEFEEVVKRRCRKKGKREEDLKDLPSEDISHTVPREELDRFFGDGCWRRMPDETYKRLRYEPASWTVENHTVEVYVGTGGDHQDEFKRGNRPADLLRNSIVTPSLMAAILNVKYVNSAPLYRIEQEFERNGIDISRQTMANWVINCSDKYLKPIADRLRTELLKYHVTQCDETRVNVIRDGRPAGTDSWMWVHRSGEFYKDRPIVVYEYQKTRHHEHPLEYYKDYKGVLVTDGLQQYHILERKINGLISANCWAHARRDLADALKAIGKSNGEAIKRSIAHQELKRIGAIYNIDDELKNMTSDERLRQRQTRIKPLVDDFFAWVKERLADTSALPKGLTAKGLNYCVNQEKYLRVFLDDGEVPIDNSASERSLKSFTIGRRNWLFINSIKGAKSSAVIYSLSETAKLNGLNPYYYFRYILTELSEIKDKTGTIKQSDLDHLLPWSDQLPQICHKK
ncbi:MAG: IS66 family transposase [Lachnospiraceae bacterium]|nr:IS66 family transposase [Lachnospiraceae bacterium]